MVGSEFGMTMNHVTKHKSSLTDLMNMMFSVLQRPSQSLDLNSVEHIQDAVEQESRSMKVHLRNSARIA